MLKRLIILIIILTCSRPVRGQVWTNLSNSTPFNGYSHFFCSVVDSVNNKLYLGGLFTGINTYTTHGVISFDGTNFDTLQGGIDKNYPGFAASLVTELAMYKNKLYVSGYFETAGSVYSPYLARWNGTSWDNINFQVNNDVKFCGIVNDELIMIGPDTIQGVKMNYGARFNGSTWTSIPEQLQPEESLQGMAYLKGRYYKYGQLNNNTSSALLFYSDGTKWIPWIGAAGDPGKAIFGIKTIDTLMWVYGRFDNIAGTNCKGLAAFDGVNWYGFGSGVYDTSWETVYSVNKINGEIYITGNIDKIDGLSNSNSAKTKITGMAKFDGQKWCLIGPNTDGTVHGLAYFKNKIYSYGYYDHFANDTMNGFSRYNGVSSYTCGTPANITIKNVGLNEYFEFGDIKIYPNPVKEILKIESESFEGMQVRLQLTDNLGRELYQGTYSGGFTEIDMNGFSPGIYFLKLGNTQTQKVFKVIKE